MPAVASASSTVPVGAGNVFVEITEGKDSSPQYFMNWRVGEGTWSNGS